MNESQIEEIKNSLREMMQLLVQRGQPLSNELKLQIARVMEHAATRITQLRQETPAVPQPTTSPISQPPSSSINNAPSPDAQLLWILAGQQEQAFISYLREYPSPATQALLNNPNELSRIIEYLSQMMPQGTPPTVNGIQHTDLNSSTIWGTKYDPKTGQMLVRFQGGSEYIYDGVPQNIYRAFSKGNASARTQGSNQYGAWFVGKNPSMGAALNQYIKAGNFPYRKLS